MATLSRQFREAVCALVHCSPEYAKDSPEYAYYSKLEAVGNGEDYAGDHQLLKDQSYQRMGVRQELARDHPNVIGRTDHAYSRDRRGDWMEVHRVPRTGPQFRANIPASKRIDL